MLQFYVSQLDILSLTTCAYYAIFYCEISLQRDIFREKCAYVGTYIYSYMHAGTNVQILWNYSLAVVSVNVAECTYVHIGNLYLYFKS